MALEQSRFFDSVGDDRTYQAEQFAEYFRLFLTDGIKNGGTNLKVTAPGTGMTVNIDYGIALIQGYAYWLENDNTGIKALTIGASTSQPRIDRVILRLDRSLSERQITVAVKEGTPATAPVPPALTRSSNVYELSLAKVSVAANAVKIENANVTDERFNASVCGLINSLITLDGSDFASQATAIINQLSTQGYLPLNGKAADADKLDGLDSTAFAKTSHTHTIANVSNLQATLDGKAPASHSHNYAATSHTHTIANVTSLQATLDGKASTANQVNDNDVPRRATIVPPNTDFNSLTAPGYYYCASNATAATMPNRPFDHAFALMVLNIGSSGPIQIAHIYNNPADHTWLRGLYEGTWTAWKRIKAGEAD
ncbi:MAG TPA: hypothetical protein PKH23_00315, partial [Bacillota bacterium]|nr:hypothetical protein [Bacillota bacterium]